MNLAEDQIRTLISKAFKRSSKSRLIIAEELSIAIEEDVTESMLYEITRCRREDKNSKKSVPSEWIPALAKITGSHELEQYALCEDCRRALAIGKIGSKAMSQHSR
jgi:hypothetical protein